MLIIGKDLGVECEKCGKSHDIDASKLEKYTKTELGYHGVKLYHLLYDLFECECGNIMHVVYTVCEYPVGFLDEEIDDSKDCKITRFLAS